MTFLLAATLFVSSGSAQISVPLRVTWPDLNPAQLQPSWAIAPNGDFVTALVHDRPARFGSGFEAPAAARTSTFVRVTDGVVRSALTLHANDPAAGTLGQSEHRVHEIVPIGDRFLTADDRGPSSISTPLLTMRDAGGRPIWTMQPETEEYAMLDAFVTRDGAIRVGIAHYVTQPPAVVTIPGDPGYTIPRRGWYSGVIAVDPAGGRVLWSRFVGNAAVEFRSDGSFVVIRSQRRFELWSADGRRTRTLTTRARECAVDHEYALLGDDALVLRRDACVKAGAVHSPPRLEAFDVATGRTLFAHDLAPGARARLGAPDADRVWLVTDEAVAPGRFRYQSWDTQLAGALRIEAFDRTGAVVERRSFEMPGLALHEARVFASPRGLFARGIAAERRSDLLDPEYFVARVP